LREPRSLIAKPAGVGAYRTVTPRDERIGQHDIARLLGSDHHANRRQVELEAAVRTVHDP